MIVTMVVKKKVTTIVREIYLVINILIVTVKVKVIYMVIATVIE